MQHPTVIEFGVWRRGTDLVLVVAVLAGPDQVGSGRMDQSTWGRTSSPSSRRAAGSPGIGEFVIGSWPDWVFG